MKSYSFQVLLKDLVSGPLMKMASLYDGTLGKMTKAAQKLSSLFKPAVQSADELRKKLETLKGKRELLVDTRQIREADKEVDRLEAKLAKLTGRDSKGRFVDRGGSKGGGKSGSGFGSWLLGGFKDLMPALGVAGLIAAGGSALGSGMNREQVGLQIQQFMKTPEATNMMMGQLNKFADVTPYSNDEVYQSGRSMLAARVGPGELLSKMNNVGNLAAGSGKNFSDLSQSYSKIKMKGFIDGGELHQEFGGTLLMEQLKKNLGVGGDDLFKMAEKRQIRFKDVDKAITDMTTGKGDYAGSLDKLASSAGGKLSTFMGTFGNKIAEWAATQNSTLGKIFDFGTEFISKMQPIEDAVSKLIDAFKPLGDSINGLLISFGLIDEKGTSVEGIINAIASIVNILATAVQLVASPVGQLILLFAGLYKGAMLVYSALFIVNAEGVVPLVATFQKLWLVMLANPITAILVGLVVLGTALKLAYDHVEWFRNGVDRAWTFIKEMFGSMGVILRALLMPTPGNLQAAFAAIGKAWKTSGDEVTTDSEMRKRQQAENERDDRTGIYGSGKSPFGKPSLSNLASSTSGTGSGVSSGVSGAKSTNITINLKSLVEGGVHVHTANVQEGLDEIVDLVTDSMVRLLNSANAVSS